MAWSRSPSFEEDDAAGSARVCLLYACDGEPWERHLRRVLQHQCVTSVTSGSARDITTASTTGSTRSSLGRHSSGGARGSPSRHQSDTNSGVSTSGVSSGGARLTIFNCRLTQVERDIAACVTPRIAEAELQVVIVSPAFLSFIIDREVHLDQVLDMNRTLALLLGVTEQQVVAEQIEGLRSFPMWRKLALRDKDRQCIAEFVAFVHGMLGGSVSCRPEEAENSDDEVHEERFTVSTAYCDDRSYLILYLLMSDPVTLEDEKLSVWLRGVLDGMPQQQLYNAYLKNPFTAFIYVPAGEFPDQTSVELVLGDDSWGVQPVRSPPRLETLGTFLSTLTSPIEFMCQTLGIDSASTAELDSVLAEKFEENCPTDIGQLRISSDLQGIETRGGRYPTLLHLAAAHGLSQLASRLVDSPGGERALMTRNEAGQLPSELAAAADHQQLAQQLKYATELNGLSKLIPRVNRTWQNVPNDVHRSLDEWMQPDILAKEEWSVFHHPSSPSSPQYAEVRNDALAKWITQETDLDILPSGPYLSMHKEEVHQDLLTSGPCFTMNIEDVICGQPDVPPPPPPRVKPQVAPSHRRDLTLSEELARQVNLPSSEQPSARTSGSSLRTASSEESSAYRSAEECQEAPDAARPITVRPRGAAAAPEQPARQTLPPGAYRLVTRRPRQLRTTEDDLRDLLADYNNCVYTRDELKAVIESWTHRSSFLQFLQDDSRPKMGAKVETSGFFSRFKNRKKSQPSALDRRDRQSSGNRESTRYYGTLLSPTFKSYAAPLDKEFRRVVEIAKAGTSLALATVLAGPAAETDTAPPPDESPSAAEDDIFTASRPSPSPLGSREGSTTGGRRPGAPSQHPSAAPEVSARDAGVLPPIPPRKVPPASQGLSGNKPGTK
ncbi:uncharacterized protein LOC122368293 isoform X2 [Amphibalanus amphitrite]|uniref:uncharacterized protein LOC122368293 isoform X2 n=1 Tax=Amphibalanus amphitrite TaxID=1232801 RepID=UPI001C9299F9|nr:uncharacterized protein LOC122368293 isoform X2 [Amphibalanus amphitrite]